MLTWLASTSWFNTVTNYPPVISFTIDHNVTGSLKNMTANPKNGQGFAVNIISEAFFKNANSTAVDAPPEFDEWALSSLTKEKCIHVHVHDTIYVWWAKWTINNVAMRMEWAASRG
ncbi:hypothetical protein BDR03DRAFT_980849 [Suillus americanus]|nr:hypothetical protein BDR03DRAFT_980849 [Suillus americanus]